MKIDIQQFDIPPDLKPYLGSIWFCAGDGPETEMSPVQSCLPTGMVELIIHLTPPRHIVNWDDEWRVFPEAIVVGLQTEPVRWKMPGGTAMLGITIKPEVFFSLFHRQISELADDYADVNDFLGNQLDGFIDNLRAGRDLESVRLETLCYFRELVHTNFTFCQRNYLPEAIQYIREATGLQSVDDVCGKVFVGKRQLQRAFQDYVGVSPKTYGRIVRFRGAYDFVHRYPQASWADVTYHFGYSDQSHFIRDFKQFTGENPTSFMTAFTLKSNIPFALSV